MICDGVFCENQRDVAWINFNEYGSTINELLQNGVNIRIVVKFVKDADNPKRIYINLMEIFERYSDMDEEDFLNGVTINEQERKRSLDYEISRYLSSVRNDRMGCPIIHAVGIYRWKPIYKDDGENIIQVLWKGRYASNYAMDEYVIG